MSNLLITRDGRIDRTHYHKLLRRYYAKRIGKVVYKGLECAIVAIDDWVQAGQTKP